MATRRIYLDESVQTDIAVGRRQRGIDAWAARDAGNRGLSDERQLEYAAREGASILTYDQDFLRIAQEWV